MKTLLFCFASILLPVSLSAGGASILVLAGHRGEASPVSISVPAQYLTAEVRIECDEDDWSLKLAGIEEARRGLAVATEKEGYKLRIEQSLVFQHSYRKFSFSSSGGSQEAVSDVLLMAPLTEQLNMIQTVKRFQSLVSGLKLAKKVRVSIGSINLALENPEALRPELLKQIRAHVEASSKLLTDSPNYLISGLDEPVQVRQTGEREVSVFLPFRVSYSQKR